MEDQTNTEIDKKVYQISNVLSEEHQKLLHNEITSPGFILQNKVNLAKSEEHFFPAKLLELEHDFLKALTDKVSFLYNKKCKLVTAKITSQASGQPGYWIDLHEKGHTEIENYVTAIYYPANSWDPLFAAFTIIKNEDQSISIIPPMENSMVVFHQSLPYANTEPSSSCKHYAIKLELVLRLKNKKLDVPKTFVEEPKVVEPKKEKKKKKKNED